MTKRHILINSLFLVLSLVLAASAGSSSGANSNSIAVTMAEFAFTPSSWSVSAGQTVTVTLTNNGALAHTWTIMSKPISGSYTDADQADIYYTSPVVPAGSSTSVTFTAPATAGTYQVICTQPDHFNSGMIGQLTVK